MLIELLLRRGDWKLSSKDFGGALQNSQWVLDIDEKVAEAHRLRGAAFVAAGEKEQAYKEQAYKEFKRAIELDPSNTDALSGVVSLIEKSNPQEAIENSRANANSRASCRTTMRISRNCRIASASMGTRSAILP